MLHSHLKIHRLKICIFVNVDWFILSHFTDYLAKIIAQNYDITVLTLSTGRCDELRSMGLRVIEVDIDRGYSSIFFEIKAFIRIFSAIREVSPDILELITIKPVIYGGLVAKLLKIHKTVFYMSGLGTLFTFNTVFGSIKSKVVTLLYKFIMRRPLVRVIVENDDEKGCKQIIIIYH